MDRVMNRKGEVVQNPAFVEFLLNNPKAAWLWVIPRIWIGWQWVEAASHKVTNPAWVSTGDALKGFWQNSVVVPETGRPLIAFGWYRTFLQFMLDAQAYTWFAKVVAYGELLVGIALILGAFTGIAAFFGAFMNWNFMMAGSASISPVMIVIAIGLILAWKISGYVGADYFLLPLLGTPWKGRPVESVPSQQSGYPAPS